MIKYLFSENTHTRGTTFAICAIFACMASLSTRRYLTVQRANSNDSIYSAVQQGNVFGGNPLKKPNRLYLYPFVERRNCNEVNVAKKDKQG